MLSTIIVLLCVIIAYAIGSICSAVIVCKIFTLPDPRTTGSNNPGATNVLRIAGKKYAILVLVADMLKGFLPVLIGQLLGMHQSFLAFLACAAVVGHIYPIFFQFKGGKGVATAIGALLGLNITLGILTVIIWGITAKLTKLSSLASIVAIILAPFISLFCYGNASAFIPLTLIMALTLYTHRSNISRIMNGTEPKIGVTIASIDESQPPEEKSNKE